MPTTKKKKKKKKKKIDGSFQMKFLNNHSKLIISYTVSDLSLSIVSFYTKLGKEVIKATEMQKQKHVRWVD